MEAPIRQALIRGLFMLLFWLILQLTLILLSLAVLVLAVFYMLDCIPERLARFSLVLKAYIVQIFHFLIFASDEKPFPVSDWPPVDEALSSTMSGRRYGSNQDNLPDSDGE